MFSRTTNIDTNIKGLNTDLKTTEFFAYVQEKNIQKVKEYFADTNYKVWQLKDENGYTALHKSVFNGDIEMTTLIIEELKKRLGLGSTAAVSKFINEKTNEGLTALHYAAYKGNLDLLEVLIKNGASAESVTNLGKNILHMAAEGNQPSMIIYLINQSGQDILSVDENGSTPLHWACYSGAEEAVNFLMYLKSEINAQDKEKLTPLHLAVLGGREKIVLRLLQKGANKNLSNSKGELPIDLAKKKNYYNIIKLLENNEDYNPLLSLETPINYIEPKDIYKKFIIFMLCIPEIIIYILVLPFLEGYVDTFINLAAFCLSLLLFFILIGKEPGYRINNVLIKEANGQYPLLQKVKDRVDVRHYCPKCFIQKSLHIKHCFICDRCVEELNHHCFWINRCIGRNNKFCYTLFLLMALFYANHSLFMCFELFWDDVNLPYDKAFPPVWLGFGRDRGFRILGGAVVGIFAFVTGFPLWFLFLIEVLKFFGLWGIKKAYDDLEHVNISGKKGDQAIVELQGKNDPLLPDEEKEANDINGNKENNEVKEGENKENNEENKGEGILVSGEGAINDVEESENGNIPEESTKL